MPNVLRVALCQLECHPSFFIDKLAFIEEPFVPSNVDHSLSSLAGSGIPGLINLKTTNKNQYINWHQHRLNNILSHPLLNDDVPLLLAFPEGSIPFELLPSIANFAANTESIVIAGTHSIQKTIEAKKIYTDLGREKSILKRKGPLGQVSFVFSGSKVNSRNKQAPSVFEHTDTSGMHSDDLNIHPYQINIKGISVKLLPLVCAEALQSPNIIGDFDLLSIISYSHTPDYFSPFIDSQSQRSKICTYLNDGAIGQSAIKFPIDRRKSSWFFNAPLQGKLPKGDSLLIIDVSLNGLSPSVGVVNPGANYEIKLLSSITYKQTALYNSKVAIELREIATIDQAEVRNKRLEKILISGSPDQNQKARIQYLEELTRSGIDNENHWNCYANDLIIDQPGLIDIESSLAKNCYQCLLPILTEDSFDTVTEKSLKYFLKNCKEKSDISDRTIELQCEAEAFTQIDTINRDWECSRILSFLDNNDEVAIQITGLLNIGKSSTIAKAIGQTGARKINRISIEPSSTFQYIFEKLLGNPWSDETPEDQEIHRLLSDQNTIRAILDWDLVWFENCEFLFTGGGWRTDDLKELFHTLLPKLQGERTKIIFETTFELQFDFTDTSILGKLRIKGFEGGSLSHGVALLNKQFRRLGLSPSDLSQQDKENVVRKIGGHPLAIIYFADAVYEEGFENVKKAINKSGGFYKRVINKILRHVVLSDEQELILRLLDGSNCDVHRDLLSGVCEFPVSDHISSLIKQCLIEIVGIDTIKLPGILKRRFQFNKLNPAIKNLFHKESAKFYTYLAEKYPSKIEYAIAAELHSRYIGEKSSIVSGFLDSKIALANSLYEERKFKEAKKIVDEILRVKKTMDIVRLSALIDAELGYHEAVIEKAKELFSINPNDAYLFQMLCKITLTQNREEITEVLVSIAQGSKIDETSIFIVQGDIARRRKQLDHAEWYYREAINHDYRKKNAWPYFFLGLTLIKLDEVEDAIEVLHEGLLLCESKPWMKSNVKDAITTQLGLAYLLIGNLEAGEPILQNLITRSPESPEIVHAYAYLLVKRDGKEKAEEAYEKFRKITPRSWRQKGHYHLFYALFLLEIGKIAEANDHFALAHKYESNNVHIMGKYARTLLSLAMKAKSSGDSMAEDYAKKCAQIVKKINDYDSKNEIAESVRIDLGYEFGIEISKIKPENL